MKNFFLIIVLFLIVSKTFAQNDYKHWQISSPYNKNQLQKNVYDFPFHDNFNDIVNLSEEQKQVSGNVKELNFKQFKTINKFGKISKGEIIRTEQYKYDTAGRIIVVNYNFHSIQDGLFFKFNYEPNIIKIQKFDKNGVLIQMQIKEYNNSLFLIKDSFYDKNGKNYANVNYLLSSENLILKEVSYHESDNLAFQSWNYEYSPNSSNSIPKSSILFKNFKRIYNNSGQEIERIDYGINGDIMNNLIFEYNEDGLCIKQFYKNEKIIESTPFRELIYDKNKNIVKIITPNAIQEYYYEYDSKNNWIKRTYLDNGIFKDITERTIFYN